MSDDDSVSVPNAARGMLQIAVQGFVTSAAVVLFFILISRLLPDIDDVGILIGLQTIIATFLLILTLGLPYAATRFISTYIGSNQRNRAIKLYPITFILSVILCAGFSSIMFLFSSELTEVMFHNLKYTRLIQLGALDVFFLGMFYSCISLLDASMQFGKILRGSIITSILRYSIAFGLFISGLGLDGIILGFAIADGFGFILFVFVLTPRLFGTNINISSLYFELKSIIRFALSVYSWSLIYFLLTRLDVYLLMIMTTPYTVGIYGPSIFISSTFLILLASLDQALVPFVSRIYGKYGIANFKSSTVRASRFLLLFYFPLGFAIAASSPTLVTVVMGPRFAESAYPMAIILAAITLSSPGVVANNLLRSAGYTGIALKAGISALLIQLLLSLILIPQFEVIGASAARFVAYIVVMTPLLYKLHRIGGFDFDRQSLKYGLIGSGIITLEIIAINAGYKGPASLILQYTVASLSYLFFLRIAHALNQKDVELLDEIFMGKLKWLTVPLSKILIRESR